MTRSIDGIHRRPAHQHDIYLVKRRLDRRTPLVSIQKRSLTSVDTMLDGIDLTLSEKPENELVLRVSRHYSIRASLSIVFQYIIIAAIAIAAAYSTSIGQWFVLALAVYVFATKKDSRLTFGIALFILVAIPLFQVLQQPGVANNMAVYVFELLVLGLAQAALETRTASRKNV